MNQVEEVHSYAPVQSAPLNSERIAYVDIGTAHSVAVTGSKLYYNDHMPETDLFLQASDLVRFIYFPQKRNPITVY